MLNNPTVVLLLRIHYECKMASCYCTHEVRECIVDVKCFFHCTHVLPEYMIMAENLYTCLLCLRLHKVQ
jgi:hypothetical protein